jgi:calcium-dependent protein kinase
VAVSRTFTRYRVA